MFHKERSLRKARKGVTSVLCVSFTLSLLRDILTGEKACVPIIPVLYGFIQKLKKTKIDVVLVLWICDFVTERQNAL